MKFKFLSVTFLLSSLAATVFARVPFDSVGVENQNGKKVILHKLDPKDNYFSIGRRYNIAPKTIIEFNNNAKLTIGDVIKVPTDLPFSAAATRTTSKPAAKSGMQTIQYKVAQGETLFGIAKKFGSTVDELIIANSLKSNTLLPGQILLVKSANPPAEVAEEQPVEKPVEKPVVVKQVVKPIEKPVVATPPPVVTIATPVVKPIENKPVLSATKPAATTKPTEKTEETFVEKPTEEPVKGPPTAKRDSTKVVAADSTDYSGHHPGSNKYGLSEKDESGVALWMDNEGLDPNKKLILHRTAPVGTVIKITNPMTNRTTFAKVVGRFNDTDNTKDVILVMTKNVAEALGALDKRFHVTISYGIPNE